jgi:hypothetical protein
MIDPINLYGLPHPMQILAAPFRWYFALKLWIRSTEDRYIRERIHLKAAAGDADCRAELAARYVGHLPDRIRENIVNDFMRERIMSEHGLQAPSTGTTQGKIIPGPGFTATIPNPENR